MGIHSFILSLSLPHPCISIIISSYLFSLSFSRDLLYLCCQVLFCPEPCRFAYPHVPTCVPCSITLGYTPKLLLPPLLAILVGSILPFLLSFLCFLISKKLRLSWFYHWHFPKFFLFFCYWENPKMSLSSYLKEASRVYFLYLSQQWVTLLYFLHCLFSFSDRKCYSHLKDK